MRGNFGTRVANGAPEFKQQGLRAAKPIFTRTSKKYPAATGGGRDRASELILSLLPGGDEAGEAFSVLRHAQSFSVPNLPRSAFLVKKIRMTSCLCRFCHGMARCSQTLSRPATGSRCQGRPFPDLGSRRTNSLGSSSDTESSPLRDTWVRCP